MKTSLVKIFAAGSFLVAGSVCVGYFTGLYQGRASSATSEYKIATAGLANIDGSDNPGHVVLREYLKARQYYYARSVKDNVIVDKIDRGPVNLDIIRGLVPVKDSSDFEFDYRQYKDRRTR
jgi:hypothetical protein